MSERKYITTTEESENGRNERKKKVWRRVNNGEFSPEGTGDKNKKTKMKINTLWSLRMFYLSYNTIGIYINCESDLLIVD